MVRSSLTLQCLQMYSKRYEDLGDDENLAELPPRRSTTALNRHRTRAATPRPTPVSSYIIWLFRTPWTSAA